MDESTQAQRFDAIFTSLRDIQRGVQVVRDKQVPFMPFLTVFFLHSCATVHSIDFDLGEGRTLYPGSCFLSLKQNLTIQELIEAQAELAKLAPLVSRLNALAQCLLALSHHKLALNV